jgi:hypothetical protein
MPRVFALAVAFLGVEAGDDFLALAISRSCHNLVLRPNAQHIERSNGRTIQRRAQPARRQPIAQSRIGKTTKKSRKNYPHRIAGTPAMAVIRRSSCHLRWHQSCCTLIDTSAIHLAARACRRGHCPA